MPVMNHIGYSAATTDKQEGLRCLLNLHMTIVQNIFARYKYYDKYYRFIDANAGDGFNCEVGESGSPLIFLYIARQKEIPFDAFFVEREEGNVLALQKVIDEKGLGGDNVHIINGDNKEEVPKILTSFSGSDFGLFYHDPNGTPDFNLIERVASTHQKLDILIRCNTRAIKRVRRVHEQYCNLAESLSKIKKEYCLIRTPHQEDTRWDWTFLLLSNFDQPAWKKKGFYKTTSPEGQELLRRLTYTEQEVKTLIEPQLSIEQTIKERSCGICEKCKVRPATEIHHKKGTYGIISANTRIHVCHQCHCELEGVLL